MEQQEQADHMRQQIERIHGSENISDQIREQIAELQKALSDSHLSIYDEKSHLMQLNREHQLLQQQDAADKRKLKELQSMATDFENGGDKTNFKDVRPESTRS